MNTIDLSKFVDKEVYLTLRNGEAYVTKIGQTHSKTYPFYFIKNSPEYMNFTREGKFLTDNKKSDYDIIRIEHRYEKPTMTEPLKDETMRTMVRCLTPEAIRYIQGHEKYAELIFTLFDEFLSEKLGEVNEQVKGEMSCFFIDGIDIKAV